MKAVVIFVCLFTVTALFAQLNVTLSFSTDGGKTWSEDFPVLADGKREFFVKAAWKVVSGKPMKIVTTRLACRERDFASANMGRRNNYGKMNQNLPTRAYWYNVSDATDICAEYTFRYTLTGDYITGMTIEEKINPVNGATAENNTYEYEFIYNFVVEQK